MRISTFVRLFEDSAIKVGSKLAIATSTLAAEVDAERRARQLFNAKHGAERRAQLDEFRKIVEATDAAAASKAIARKPAKRKARK